MVERILIADDHSIVRIGLSLIIKKHRPEVVIEEADNFKSVLELIGKTKFDLVIMDVNMPNGNFQQTFDLIKIKQPHVKVLVYSSQDEHIYAIRYLKLGVDGFLPKMANPETVHKALKKMFEKGEYVSQEVKDTLVLNSLNKNGTQQNPISTLSEREMEIADKLMKGSGLKEISADLNIHVSTASTYKTRIFKKLEVHSIPELIDVFRFYQDLMN